MKTKVFITILTTFLFYCCQAQTSRLSERNNVGWYNYFGNYKMNSKFSIHSEYQWRRDEIIKKWQQSLFRTGINYQIKPETQIRFGYAWIETFAYGDIPINALGRDFTEHRIYQMLTLTDKISSIEISHRFILEQRWVGRYSSTDLPKEDEFPFLNRWRYMVRFQFPLRGNDLAVKTPYLAIYDELMIGFGKNVAENIFDQNRLGILFGYRFSQIIGIEIGFLNQIVQLGREINNQNVFQYNNGIIINTFFRFDR